MSDIRAIKNYILFLNNEHGLSVSLHTPDFDPIINSTELCAFNIHTNSYCTYIKTCKAAQKQCVCMQKKVFDRCKTGAYCGTCHAGVSEFVYPIKSGEESIGFISVSGYKSVDEAKYLKRMTDKFGFDYSELKNLYATLNESDIRKEYIDTLIQPLADMLELAHLKNADNEELSFPAQIENYIKQNRNQEITSKDICEHFSCSRSYMSTQFNKFKGKTIREYITELRIADAKALLKHSTLNITEIAFSVGFSDANYFSYIFKKLNKLSPLEYRKASRK